MNAGFVLGGVEMAIAAPSGPLERLVCDQYAWFLSRITKPRCWLTMALLAGPREGITQQVVSRQPDGTIRLDHPWFEGTVKVGGRADVRVLAQPWATDTLLKAMVTIIASENRMIVVDGAGVTSSGRGHLLLGDKMETLVKLATSDRRPIIGLNCMVIWHSSGRWLLSGTPFGSVAGWPARSADLVAVWLLAEEGRQMSEIEILSGAEGAGLLVEHASPGAWSTSQPAKLLDVCIEVGRGVPAARLAVADIRSWDRIDELAAALRVRTALSATQPELRSRLLRGALNLPLG